MTTATREEPRDHQQSPDPIDRPAHRSERKSRRSVPKYRPLEPRAVPLYAIGAAVLAAITIWAYWPTLVELVNAWDTEPDYSHGYFVIPLAIYFLWFRRKSFPGIRSRVEWPGLTLILLSILMRFLGTHFYVGSVDAWSLLLWLGGVAWLFGGSKVLLWSSPAIAFLVFMIPLPWKVERWLSVPLQRIATNLSVWVLQLFGQPALAEGNTIRIDESVLRVADACSGLRIFVGIVALAFAYLILVRRSWWERAALLVSVIPIALIANSARIVATSLLNQMFVGDAAHHRIHDWSGFVMIPFAALMFWLVLLYLGNLVREKEVVGVGSVARDNIRK